MFDFGLTYPRSAALDATQTDESAGEGFMVNGAGTRPQGRRKEEGHLGKTSVSSREHRRKETTVAKSWRCD